jgi:acetolactate synthase I/II/III large subunit
VKVATYIASFLRQQKIETVFELQGGMITRIIDALHHAGGVKIVSVHHEQAAAFAADAYGRLTNRPGVALATSGPGATNLLTGVGNCYFDSVPAIFITGQVNVNEQKGDRPTRQIGFQETDIVSMARPVTKAAYAIKAAREVPRVFQEACRLATSGRPGPVLIDIPMNVQNEEVGTVEGEVEPAPAGMGAAAAGTFLERYGSALARSRRPLILVGRGLRAAGEVPAFRELLGKLAVPVATSLLGVDALPYGHPQRVGVIGTYGNRWANYALGNCDLLLVLGSRLDLRQTGSDVASFEAGKQIFHVDIEAAELNNRIGHCVTLQASLPEFFAAARAAGLAGRAPAEWVGEIERQREQHPDTGELRDISGINPNRFMHQLARASGGARAFVADVGNNQMWCAQSLELAPDQVFLTSGGMGAMGYSLPAAIGASITLGDEPVVAVSGDGGFQINLQELQTVVRNQLPIKIVVLNNHCLGMIRQFQDSYFSSCYQSTLWGYSAPDFARVAAAYGLGSCAISAPEEVAGGLAQLWREPARPFLLEVSIDIHTNVFPKTMFGSPITRMEPLLPPAA